jgi:hypothetical protein
MVSNIREILLFLFCLKLPVRAPPNSQLIKPKFRLLGNLYSQCICFDFYHRPKPRQTGLSRSCWRLPRWIWSFLNRDSFLNQAFLNRDFTVLITRRMGRRCSFTWKEYVSWGVSSTPFGIPFRLSSILE